MSFLRKNGMSPRLLLTYVVLGFGYPGMIGFVFMQYVYYDAMMMAMQITNTQLGLLLTIDALGAMLLALPGGILADRFDCKKVLALSLGIATLACVWFALYPTYRSALVVWSVLAVVMCGFYPAVFKVVRIIAPENGQGKSFGIFGACNAIGFMAVNFTALSVYHAVHEGGGPVEALSAVLWVFAAALGIGTIVGYLLLRGVSNPEAEATEVDRFSFANLKQVLKMPGTWLVFIVGFCINGLHLSISYFTPYFTNVLGTALVVSGSLAVIRQYGVRLAASPLGGWYGDRIGSTTKVIRLVVSIAALLIAAIMLLPAGTALPVIIILVLLLAFMNSISLSLCYSTFAEALIPRRYMGTVIGVITILLPDLFIPPLYGYWLDTYGNYAYRYIFSFTILICLICVVGAGLIIRRAEKYRRRIVS